MTRCPSLTVIARAVAESIPPDTRTTAISTIVSDIGADAKGLANDGSQVDSPGDLVKDEDVELVPVAADAGHREKVPPRKGSISVRVAECEGPVREGPEAAVRQGPVRQDRDSV